MVDLLLDHFSDVEVENVGDNEELREEYDQYNDDPTFNNRQREYYNQR